VIRSSADQGTEDVFDGKNTAAARRSCPKSLWSLACRKLDQLDSATELADQHIPPGNRLEALKGDRKSQHSIRINEQYRICFKWTDVCPEDVEIVDYHKQGIDGEKNGSSSQSSDADTPRRDTLGGIPQAHGINTKRAC
jgi:proteic killer suppression protein